MYDTLDGDGGGCPVVGEDGPSRASPTTGQARPVAWPSW